MIRTPTPSGAFKNSAPLSRWAALRSWYSVLREVFAEIPYRLFIPMSGVMAVVAQSMLVLHTQVSNRATHLAPQRRDEAECGAWSAQAPLPWPAESDFGVTNLFDHVLGVFGTHQLYCAFNLLANSIVPKHLRREEEGTRYHYKFIQTKYPRTTANNSKASTLRWPCLPSAHWPRSSLSPFTFLRRAFNSLSRT